jgi:hypothetical protein
MKLLAVTILAALNWYYIPGDGSYRQLDDKTSIPGKLRGVLTNEAAAVAWQAQVASNEAVQAAIAASNAAYQASQPQQFPTGIESPVLVLQTVDGKGVGVVADGLDLVTYVDHTSPRPDAATLAARVAAAKAERQALRDVLKDIRVETTNNIADCVTISASTTNTANAAQGTQIKKLADELADTNRQLNRLRKALLDYLRGTE